MRDPCSKFRVHVMTEEFTVVWFVFIFCTLMLYCPHVRLIGVGRLINPDYQKFTDVLLAAQKNFTLENKVKIYII